MFLILVMFIIFIALKTCTKMCRATASSLTAYKALFVNTLV